MIRWSDHFGKNPTLIAKASVEFHNCNCYYWSRNVETPSQEPTILNPNVFLVKHHCPIFRCNRMERLLNLRPISSLRCIFFFWIFWFGLFGESTPHLWMAENTCPLFLACYLLLQFLVLTQSMTNQKSGILRWELAWEEELGRGGSCSMDYNVGIQMTKVTMMEEPLWWKLELLFLHAWEACYRSVLFCSKMFETNAGWWMRFPPHFRVWKNIRWDRKKSAFGFQSDSKWNPKIFQSYFLT